jgi:hypothetical protein
MNASGAPVSTNVCVDARRARRHQLQSLGTHDGRRHRRDSADRLDAREKEGPASVLRFNPATKQLTAVEAGTATLKLSVNAEKVLARVKVVAAPGDAAPAG